MAALEANAAGDLDGSTGYTGRTRTQLSTPRHFVYSTRAEPMFADDGTLLYWELEMFCGVATNMNDTTQDTHDGYAAAVQDFVMRDDVPDVLNGLIDGMVTFGDGIFGWEPGACTETDGPEIIEMIRVIARVTMEGGV